jgi:hypothetical protein
MDIVERLREAADDYATNQTETIEWEAADEIERLREQNAVLLKALTDLYEVCRWEKVAPEIDAAKAVIAKATGGE